MTVRAFVLLFALLLAACTTAGPSTEVATPSPGAQATIAAASQAPTSAPTPTTAPTTASPATAACIISSPTQMLTDFTPVVIQYDGASADQCAKYLAVAPDASQWTKDHPPTQLSSPPSEEPACRVSVAGVKATVWGTTAAQFVCKSLQAAASMTP